MTRNPAASDPGRDGVGQCAHEQLTSQKSPVGGPTVARGEGKCGVEAERWSLYLVPALPLLALWSWERYFTLGALVFSPVTWGL